MGQPNHDHIASLYHNLGGIEHAAGNYAAGEALARQGPAIRMGLGTNDSLRVAQDLVALGALLDGQGKYAASEPLYLEALRIFGHAPRANAGEIAVTLNDLGAQYTEREVFDKAGDMLERAVALKRPTLGPRHPRCGRHPQQPGHDVQAEAECHSGRRGLHGGHSHRRAVARRRAPEDGHLPGEPRAAPSRSTSR